MRPSLRFLALAIVGWVGVRAAALDTLPGGELFRIGRSEAKTPPIVPTQFPPVEPVALAQPYPNIPYAPAAYEQPAARPVLIPVYYPAPVSTPAVARSPHLDALLPEPRRAFYAASPALDDMPLSRLAAVSIPARSSVPVQITPDAQPLRSKLGCDRVARAIADRAPRSDPRSCR